MSVTGDEKEEKVINKHPEEGGEPSPGLTEEKAGVIGKLRERLGKSRRGFVDNRRSICYLLPTGWGVWFQLAWYARTCKRG